MTADRYVPTAEERETANLEAALADLPPAAVCINSQPHGPHRIAGTWRDQCPGLGGRIDLGADGCGCPITEEITANGASIEGTERVEHRERCWNAGPLADVAEVWRTPRTPRRAAMNNTDERDYAEEQANRRLLETPECPGHVTDSGVPYLRSGMYFCDGRCVTTKTRTYYDMYADLTAVMGSTYTEPLPPAEYSERLRALWDEIAKAAAADRDVPSWASLAAVLLRDRYAQDARIEASRL